MDRLFWIRMCVVWVRSCVFPVRHRHTDPLWQIQLSLAYFPPVSVTVRAMGNYASVKLWRPDVYYCFFQRLHQLTCVSHSLWFLRSKELKGLSGSCVLCLVYNKGGTWAVTCFNLCMDFCKLLFFLKSSAQSKHLKTFEQDLSYISKPDNLKGPSAFFFFCYQHYVIANCTLCCRWMFRLGEKPRTDERAYSLEFKHMEHGVHKAHVHTLKKKSPTRKHTVFWSPVANPRHCFILAFAPQCS